MSKRVTHGSCGRSWVQKGNRSGHCSNCHETYCGERTFDRHFRIVDNQMVCQRNGPHWWADDDGQWHHGDPEAIRRMLRPNRADMA